MKKSRTTKIATVLFFLFAAYLILGFFVGTGNAAQTRGYPITKTMEKYFVSKYYGVAKRNRQPIRRHWCNAQMNRRLVICVFITSRSDNIVMHITRPRVCTISVKLYVNTKFATRLSQNIC